MNDCELPPRIGPYEVVGLLGEGGMGTVYLAEQHGALERRVALKVIKLGMDSREVLRRFEAERGALARMSHENVARVFDAGRTDRGQPFFVMEFVEGQPLTEFCDEHRLSTEERIRLFVKVCAGVQHAHFKGIVHRDLKPSNVLVTEQDGGAVPKIIDFGLARATERGEGEASLLTEQGQILGTPEYMSPEQAAFDVEDVDARTDVYSLGVLLYELLVGALPLTRKEMMSDGLLEGLRRIREGTTPRPSTRLRQLDVHVVTERRRTTVPELARRLRGDLDWILLRALEKDRERRYPSPEALAADLERHLARRPILARPPSTAYQVRKFVVRNRVPVAAALAVSAALLAGLASYAMENRRARLNGLAAIEARGLAEERLRLAMDAIESYFTGVSEDTLLQQPELAELRTELLRAPLTFYAQLRTNLEASGSSAADRARLAEALANLAKLTTAVGAPEEACATYSDAIGLQRELVGEEPRDAARRAALMATLLDSGRLLLRLGRIEEAEVRARELEAELAGQSPDEGGVWRARACELLAATRRETGRLDEAESALLEAIALREGRSAAHPDERRELASARGQLAALYDFSKDLEQAEAQYTIAADLREALLEESPEDLSLLDEAAQAQEGLAMLLTRSGRYEEAIPCHLRALERREALVRAQPAVGYHRSAVALTRLDLGLTLNYLGRHSDSRAEYEAALDELTELVDEYPEVLRYRTGQARARLNLAELLARMNLHADGVPLVELALEGYERLAAEQPANLEFQRDLATSANTLAILCQGLGRLEDAERGYRRTAAALSRLLEAHPESVMFRGRLSATRYNLAQLIERQGDYGAALEHYDSALATAWPAGAPEPEDRLARIILARANRGKADALCRLGRYDESLETWDGALAFAADDAQRLELRIVRLVASVRRDGPEIAAAELERVLAESPVVTGDHHFYAAQVHAQVHAAAPGVGAATRALASLRRALEAGTFENPNRLQAVREDPFLDPLRHLAEFEGLLAELE